METVTWKEQILRSYKRLVESDLYRALDECLAADIFTMDEMEKVENSSTQSDKNRQFLRILLRKSEKIFRNFVECLNRDSTDFSHVLKIMSETDVTPPFKQERWQSSTQLRSQIFLNLKDILEGPILKDFTDDFISYRVFEIDDWEKISSTNLTTTEQNRTFVNILLKKQHGYHLLMSKLREIDNQLVEKIESTKVTEEVNKEMDSYLRKMGNDSYTGPTNLERIGVSLESEEISLGKLMSWKEDDEIFFPTRATEHVYNELVNKRKVIVSGLPGAGKSANVHHIALRLKNEGHRLCCVQRVKEMIDKMDKFDKEEKQVYVIDDAFGVHGVNEDRRKEWSEENKDDLQRCLNNTSIKILCTSRMQVTEDEKISNIKSNFAIVNVSQGMNELTSEEQVEIFRKHALVRQRDDLLTDDVTKKISDIKCPVGCFPLVCRLYVGDREIKQPVPEFFVKPMDFIADHLQKLKVEDRLGYFCLLLCLISDNSLKMKPFIVGDESKENKKLRKELLEVCELPASTPRPTIQNKINTLLHTFMKLEGDTYSFVHAIIHDSVTKHVSTMSSNMHSVILRHCSDAFMRHRVHLSGVKCRGHVTEDCINIRSDAFTIWGDRVLQIIHDGINMSDRLYNDIREGICSLNDRRVWLDNPWYDVFMSNPCVRCASGDAVIAKALSDKSPSEIQYIMCSPGYRLWSDGLTRHMALHWAVYRGLTHVVTKTLSVISQTKLREVDSIDSRGLLSWARYNDMKEILMQKFSKTECD